MEIYHVDDTYPPIDLLLNRDSVYIDPTDATGITVNARINSIASAKLTANLSNNVTVVADADGNNRVRIKFVSGDLDTVGVYQLQVVLTWADGTETSPTPHEFKVVTAWT